MEADITASGVYVMKYVHREPQVALLKRIKPDVFGYYYSLPGGTPNDRCSTDRRVKFRTARSELREETGLSVSDMQLFPARRRNPSETNHHGIRMKLYTYFTFLPKYAELRPVETNKHTKDISWFSLPDFFKLFSQGLIHPALIEGWWWKIAAFDMSTVGINRQNELFNKILFSINPSSAVLDEDAEDILLRD